VESAPASEHLATHRSDDVRNPVRDGIGLDGERKHQRLREGAPGRKSVGTGRHSIVFDFPVFGSGLSTIGNLSSWEVSQVG